MNTNATKTAKTNEVPGDAERKHLEDIAEQLEMAFTDETTPGAVKDCLKTIITEAATNAGKALPDFDYISHVRAVLPGIITSLGKEYGAGVLHSIAAILLYDTKVFSKFHNQKIDEEKAFEITQEKRLKQGELLNDRLYAQTFTDKKLLRAKELIAQILMVTGGDSVVVGNLSPKEKEWGQHNLLELFEMLSLRHENFYIPDFVDELKAYLFSWTWDYSDSKNAWINEIMSQRGLDGDGNELEMVETENEMETSEIVEFPQPADKSQNLETLANQLSAIMKNPLLPERLYNAMTDELVENDIDSDSPEYILGSLRKQMQKG
jgi:hypothetical protein